MANNIKNAVYDKLDDMSEISNSALELGILKLLQQNMPDGVSRSRLLQFIDTGFTLYDASGRITVNPNRYNSGTSQQSRYGLLEAMECSGAAISGKAALVHGSRGRPTELADKMKAAFRMNEPAIASKEPLIQSVGFGEKAQYYIADAGEQILNNRANRRIIRRGTPEQCGPLQLYPGKFEPLPGNMLMAQGSSDKLLKIHFDDLANIPQEAKRNCNALALYKCSLEDETLKQILTEIPSLKELRIVGCRGISEAALAGIHEQYPKLRILITPNDAKLQNSARINADTEVIFADRKAKLQSYVEKFSTLESDSTLSI